MIEIPIGKVFMAVDSGILAQCSICDLRDYCTSNDDMACCSNERKDGKNIVFKIVDYKVEQ